MISSDGIIGRGWLSPAIPVAIIENLLHAHSSEVFGNVGGTDELLGVVRVQRLCLEMR